MSSTTVQPHYLPEPVTPEVNNEWALLVDTGHGLVELPNVSRLALVNQKRGIDLLWGLSPNSTPTFKFAAPWRVGGGGASTILWTVNPFGKLYVGAVLQQRNFIDPLVPTFNSVRGLARPGEDTLSAIRREFAEETGSTELFEPVLLPGVSANMDSALLDGNPEFGGQVDFYASRIPWRMLVPVKDADDTYVFGSQGLTDDQRKENIFGCRFVEGDLSKLAVLADGFTIIVFARLLVAMGRH